MTVVELLEKFARASALHMMGEPAPETDLRRIEHALGCRLPAAFRTFLARFGGGVFFQSHEIFGPGRVMIHDIELVPDLLSIRSRMPNLAPHLIAFHRSADTVHALDLSDGSVVSLSQPRRFPDFTSFLAAVVLGDISDRAER